MPLPEFMIIPDLAAAKEAGIKFGYPYMLKARKLAYDGKGESQMLVLYELSGCKSGLQLYSVIYNLKLYNVAWSN